MRATATRLRCVLMLATAGVTLAACGGGSKPPAPGSPEKPLVAEQTRLGGAAPKAGAGARSNEAAAPSAQAKPGYESLVSGQSRRPRSRFTPCNLVTVAQAQAIVGAPMQQPVEAPLGPTCIYRSRDRKSMVTVAVQTLDFTKLKSTIRRRRRVAVGTRTAYCGTYGQPMLYVPLSAGRVLAVAAQCTVARRFALKAVRQLPA